MYRYTPPRIAHFTLYSYPPPSMCATPCPPNPSSHIMRMMAASRPAPTPESRPPALSLQPRGATRAPRHQMMRSFDHSIIRAIR